MRRHPEQSEQQPSKVSGKKRERFCYISPKISSCDLWSMRRDGSGGGEKKIVPIVSLVHPPLEHSPEEEEEEKKTSIVAQYHGNILYFLISRPPFFSLPASLPCSSWMNGHVMVVGRCSPPPLAAAWHCVPGLDGGAGGGSSGQLNNTRWHPREHKRGRKRRRQHFFSSLWARL